MGLVNGAVRKTCALSTLCLSLALGGPPATAQPADDASAGAKPRRFVRVPAPDGIQIRRFNKTEGQMPSEKSRVVVHYHGTLQDGSVFDSSVERGSPANFALDKVIPCWTQALTRLRVGEKAEIRCPPATAYGLKGSPPNVPPNARLTFQVEILGIL